MSISEPALGQWVLDRVNKFVGEIEGVRQKGVYQLFTVVWQNQLLENQNTLGGDDHGIAGSASNKFRLAPQPSHLRSEELSSAPFELYETEEAVHKALSYL